MSRSQLFHLDNILANLQFIELLVHHGQEWLGKCFFVHKKYLHVLATSPVQSFSLPLGLGCNLCDWASFPTMGAFYIFHSTMIFNGLS